MLASIEQIWNIVASLPKFVSSPTFIVCSPMCSNNCGVVFFVKIYFSFREMTFFARSLKYANFLREYYPSCVTSCDDCTRRYFCEHNPLFYHLNLIPCRYWSWQRNIYFLVNIFVRHTFPMSKSSIKTKTVLKMTDMTESTELQAFKRSKDGYKFTVKNSLCICVVLSWDELKVRQIFLIATMEYTWRAYLSPPLLLFDRSPGFALRFSPPSLISQASHAIIWYRHKWIFTMYKDFCLRWIENIKICAFFTNRCFSGSEAVKSGLLLQRYWNF